MVRECHGTHHRAFALAQTPPEHSFALDVTGLLDPAITFFSCCQDSGLLGIGAIKQLDLQHAEIKSMHTAETARGRGWPTCQRVLVVAAAGRYSSAVWPMP